jgi:hypothetical protein
MSKLSLSNYNWHLVSVLINLLKLFYISTTLLQTQRYHTLSTGKIIENALMKSFEKKKNDISCCKDEKLLSESVVTSINKYLNQKITVNQKSLMLVIINYQHIIGFNFLFFKKAAYLDPKTFKYLSDSEIKDVQSELSAI